MGARREAEGRPIAIDGWTVRAAAGVDAMSLGERVVAMMPHVWRATDAAALARSVEGAQVQRWRPWRAAFLLAASGGQVVHVKTYRPKNLFERTVALFLPSRGETSWEMGEALRAAGLATPRPVLLATRPRAGTVLVTDPLVNPVLLTDELKRLLHAKQSPRALLREVARLAAAMHAAGFLHGDFTASNVLLHGPGPRSLAVIDLDRTKRLPLLPPVAAIWLQSLDLRLLLLTTWGEVSRRDWLVLLAEYVRARGLSRPLQKLLARRVLSAKRGRVRVGASTGTIGGREPWG